MKTNLITETDIAAYLEGGLAADRRKEIEQLLALDLDFFDEVFALYHISQADSGRAEEGVPSWLIRDVIALGRTNESFFDLALGLAGDMIRVLSHGSGIDLSFPEAVLPLRAGGRVTSRMVVIKKSCEDLDAELHVEKTGAGFCTIRVVVPEFRDVLTCQLRAEIILDGKVLASEGLSGGCGVFDTVSPGKYHITLRKDRRILGDFTISISEL